MRVYLKVYKWAPFPAGEVGSLYPYSSPPEKLSKEMGSWRVSVLFQIFTDAYAPSVSKSLNMYVLNLQMLLPKSMEQCSA
jgi:hypothetical protein